MNDKAAQIDEAANTARRAFNHYSHTISDILRARTDRKLAIYHSRHPMRFRVTAEKDKAILAQYGLKSEGFLTTVFSLETNLRHNAHVMERTKQEGDQTIADAKAISNMFITAAQEQVKKLTQNPAALTPKP